MARVDWIVLIFAVSVAVVLGADNSTTTPAPTSPTTPATTPTPRPPRTPGILETIETFISAIPVGLATACQTSAQAVKNFFQNPWW